MAQLAAFMQGQGQGEGAAAAAAGVALLIFDLPTLFIGYQSNAKCLN